MKKCILDDIYEHLGRFVIYPSEHARVMHTLWIAHTHLIDLVVRLERGLVYQYPDRGAYYDGGAISESE